MLLQSCRVKSARRYRNRTRSGHRKGPFRGTWHHRTVQLITIVIIQRIIRTGHHHELKVEFKKTCKTFVQGSCSDEKYKIKRKDGCIQLWNDGSNREEQGQG